MAQQLAISPFGTVELTLAVGQQLSVLTNLPDDEELTVSFGIQNGEAAAKTLAIDYIRVEVEE